ncbi:hypothetical protein H9P43_003425 [Blastocladiella emersonii ATCC 22665]|nr:hypothetical protein H9P43_003425 [Blastocladiella emersonii ATCC 22665]
MGCGASKEAAHAAASPSTTTAAAPAAPVLVAETAKAAPAPAPVVAAAPPTAVSAPPPSHSPARSAAAPSPSSRSSAAAGLATSGASKPASAATAKVDPTVRSDSGIGTRHSAGSSKSLGVGSAGVTRAALPSISPTGVSLTAATAVAEESIRPTSFDIPLDDTVKVRARKPMSANPRNRRRTQLQPMAHLSNDEIQRKLREAETRWEEDPAALAKDKDLDPTLLRALVADREARIAANRARELEEKKTRLAMHDAHMREVAERKMRLLAATAGAASATGVDADGVPVLTLSGGGWNKSAGNVSNGGGSRSTFALATEAIPMGLEG